MGCQKKSLQETRVKTWLAATLAATIPWSFFFKGKPEGDCSKNVASMLRGLGKHAHTMAHGLPSGHLTPRFARETARRLSQACLSRSSQASVGTRCAGVSLVNAAQERELQLGLGGSRC